MTPVSVVLVGSSPDAADDITVARAMAARLGGRYDLIVPCGPAVPGEVDLAPLYVHRLRPANRPRYVPAARHRLDALALDRRAAGPAVPGERVVLMSSDPLAALVVEWSRARRGLPHLFQLQGEVVVPGPEYGGWLKRRVLGAATRAAVRRASGVRVVNERLGTVAAAMARGPVAVIGTRVDTTVFVPRPDRYGGGPDAVMLGSLLEVKNHATAVRAWARVLRDVPDARLVIAGEGRCRGRLDELIGALGLREHVQLVGPLPYRDVPGLLAGARCLMQPSWSEGQPRVVLEAMACGLPVLCSDIPAHRELVPPDVGVLVPPGDVAAWAAAIVGLLCHPAAAGRRGARARELAVARYDFASNLDRMAGFIATIAAESDSRARANRNYAKNV